MFRPDAAAQAPHHGLSSWTSHWSNNHDLPDKILNAAKNGLRPFGTGEDGEPSRNASPDNRITPLQQPNYRESSSSGANDSDDDYGNIYEDSEEDEGNDINEPLRRYRASEMSEPKQQFNEADKYMVAKYIAGFPRFDSAPSLERWERFEEKVKHAVPELLSSYLPRR